MFILYTGFKLKALADDTLNEAERLKFVFEREENIGGIGENDVKQHFLLFLTMFS